MLVLALCLVRLSVTQNLSFLPQRWAWRVLTEAVMESFSETETFAKIACAETQDETKHLGLCRNETRLRRHSNV